MMLREKYQIQCQDIDFDKLLSLRLEALRNNPEAFGEKYVDAAEWTTEEWRLWFLQRHNEVNKIFVVQRNSEYIGMCGLAFDKNDFLHPYLWGIYIHPEERNRGLGRELVAQAIENLKKYSVSAVTLRVEKENIKALAFYKSLGFVESGFCSGQTEMKIEF